MLKLVSVVWKIRGPEGKNKTHCVYNLSLNYSFMKYYTCDKSLVVFQLENMIELFGLWEKEKKNLYMQRTVLL